MRCKPFAVRESMRSWREQRAFDFAIRTHDAPNHHLGNVSIWHTSRQFRVGEIGYWVRSDATSRGLATEATAETLRDLGCDVLQGYLYGKPVSAKAFEAQI